MDLPLAVLFTDALVGGEPRQGGFQRGQAVAGGQAHVKQLSLLLTRHTGTHRATVILRTGNGGLSAPRSLDNDDPKESRLFKPSGWVRSEAPPASEDYVSRDPSPERPCHLGPVSSRGKGSPPASACCCSTEAERPVKQAAAARHRATEPWLILQTPLFVRLSFNQLSYNTSLFASPQLDPKKKESFLPN